MAVEMGILHTANVILLRYLLKKGFENMIPKELSHYFEEGDHNQVLYYRVSQDKKAGVQDTRVAETIREMLSHLSISERAFRTGAWYGKCLCAPVCDSL